MTPVVALSSGTIAAIVVVLILDLFAIVFGLSFMRSRKAQRAAEAGLPSGPAPEAPKKAPTKAPKPMSRREFFRKSLIASLLVFGAEFGGASLAFMWPFLKGGFGSVINAGKLEDIKAVILETSQPYYLGSGRFYVVAYQGKPTDEVNYENEGVSAQGIMPLYQRCVHLGCRVPFCQQSSWFECPCHGSKYNGAGEYQLGPAPRGMDRFKVSIADNGDVLVDTSEVILGPPRGTETISPSHGPFCVAPG